MIVKGWVKSGLGEVLNEAKQIEALKFSMVNKEEKLGEEEDDQLASEEADLLAEMQLEDNVSDEDQDEDVDASLSACLRD